jgi:AcrR family transcriptional regulator
MSDRRRARHEATRQEILEAAWDLARRQGLTGWSLREVASAVGMQAPSLYVYFDSKDAIYDAMFAQGYRELLARIDATPLDEGPEALLRRSAHLYFTFCVEDPARQQLLFLRVIPGFEPSPEAYALAEEALDRGRAVLHRAGFTEDADVDLWTAMLTGLVTQQLSNDPGGDRWARLLDDAVAMLIAARGAQATLAGPGTE